jgi:threonine aldolase
MSAPWRGFASDNYAGIHPEVLEALTRANAGHAVAYGDDDETERLRDLVREHFGPQAQVFPVFNGTGANVVALQSMCRPWEAVICAESAHVNVDEGGAPEKVAGLKLWTVPTADGLLTPELVDVHAVRAGDVHRAQQAVVTITQSSELGTAYTVDQLGRLADHVHSRGLRLHLDGARLANAAASLGVALREITTDVGVDAVSFGGTKNGAMGAEAVIVLDPELARDVPFLRKSAMQLASKMRFVSAQLAALLTDDLWLRNASHAKRWRVASRSPFAPSPALTSCAESMPTRSSQSCRRLSLSDSSATTASTPGTTTRVRCAGCAPGTPQRRTLTRSRRLSHAR